MLCRYFLLNEFIESGWELEFLITAFGSEFTSLNVRKVPLIAWEMLYNGGKKDDLLIETKTSSRFFLLSIRMRTHEPNRVQSYFLNNWVVARTLCCWSTSWPELFVISCYQPLSVNTSFQENQIILFHLNDISLTGLVFSPVTMPTISYWWAKVKTFQRCQPSMLKHRVDQIWSGDATLSLFSDA